MNPEHVVAVAVRLFAIGLAVYAVTGAVGTAPVYFAGKFEPSVFLLVIGTTLLTLIAALLLWRFPLWIASKLFPYDHSRSGGSTSITGGELQTVAFTVLVFISCSRLLLPRFIGFFGLARAINGVRSCCQSVGVSADDACRTCSCLFLGIWCTRTNRINPQSPNPEIS